VAEATQCPVCAQPVPDLDALTAHFVQLADASDGPHVMWLNRNVTKFRLAADDLGPLLRAALAGEKPPGERRVRR
jgi:hypothetical protein